MSEEKKKRGRCMLWLQRGKQKNIEVIGNIYDNPELLKGENNDKL